MSADSSATSALDPNDIVVGTVQGAWGVRGEVRVVPQSDDAAALLHTKRWRLTHAAHPAGTALDKSFDVTARRHGTSLVARLAGIDDRDAAQALTGAQISLPRAAFPRAAKDEFYWVDLIGCDVLNREQQPLGQVQGLIDTGVHSVLRVTDAAQAQRLIPFVAAYVDTVDLKARRIVVDWGLDY